MSYLTELLFGFPCCISLGLIVLPSTTISRGSIIPCIVGLKSINSFGRFESTEMETFSSFVASSHQESETFERTTLKKLVFLLEFFTNTQSWQCVCWHSCQLCITIYLQFSSLFAPNGLNKCEIRIKQSLRITL